MEQDEIEMQLWEYIDSTCSEADRQRIAMLIATDPLWQEGYTELSLLHTGISSSLELEQPSMRFTKDVMDAVAATHIAPATKKYINLNIVRGIAAFFIIGVATLLGVALATANMNDGHKLALPDLGLETLFNSTFFYAAIGVNILLALLLADVVVRRKQAAASGHEEA